MCGRYTLTASAEVLQRTFQLEAMRVEILPRYNIAPTQSVPIITGQAPRQLSLVQWGLVPSWAKDASGASQLINARAETIDEKPSFRGAFKQRRCLIPADGFYEWGKDGKPQFIYFEDKHVFGLAGLWEEWKSADGELARTCTIITTEPNDLIKLMHHRMAVILQPNDYEAWLTPDTPPDHLKSLLATHPSDGMASHEVSPTVNNARIESADLILPFASPQQRTLF